MEYKPSFLHQNKPLNTCMIQTTTIAAAIRNVRDGKQNGADAFGFQLEKIPDAERSEEKLKSLFAEMGRCPAYVTNYRYNENEGKTDEELFEGLMEMLRCGATLVDIMGDYFAPDPIQVTMDPAAIEKQKEIIQKVHDAGGEVLMSSHVLKYIPPEEVLRIAKEHQSRGADIAKIVTSADTEEEELENLRAVRLLRKELDIPFLFLCGGKYHKLLRAVGPLMGCCTWLTVLEHDELATLSQPLTRSIRAIAENFDIMF